MTRDTRNADRRLRLYWILLPLCLNACQRVSPPAEPAVDGAAYMAEIEDWRGRRIASLTRPDGWLSLAGLFWIDEGEHSFGADRSNDFVFPSGSAPDFIGSIVRQGREVRVKIRSEVDVLLDGSPVSEMALQTDMDEGTSILTLGSLSWYVIEREEDRMAVRLRDSAHPNLTTFTGIDAYPTDPAWRVQARVAPYDPPKTLSIPTIYGTVLEEPSTGALVFDLGGRTHRLDYLPEGDAFFVIFGDTTNASETYPAGRYLYVEAPGPGETTFVDFNRAYNPPCVFTAFATCPLPPEQNRLPIGVTAGEKRYAVH